MLEIIPGEIPHQRLHQLLLGAVAPRPIAFASTVDMDGRPNLSPFSFFNVFGVNPTTLIFSPSRRGRNNTTKDTFENLKVVPEVVINSVTYDMVYQASLASTGYEHGTDEFLKAGFTKVPSVHVRPFRVEESPVQIECKVRQIIETGTGGGAANLIICEVLVMHISEDILNEKGLIDPNKIRLVGRMSESWYIRAFGDGMFKVVKPTNPPGIGIDGLPGQIRDSSVLTGNDLGRLGNMARLPDAEESMQFAKEYFGRDIIIQGEEKIGLLHHEAQKLIGEGRVWEALCILMI